MLKIDITDNLVYFKDILKFKEIELSNPFSIDNTSPEKLIVPYYIKLSKGFLRKINNLEEKILKNIIKKK